MAPVLKKIKNKCNPVDKKAKVQKSEYEQESTVISGQLEKRIARKGSQPAKRGVLFIKHLPHGFFEDQLKGYFEQFGKVTKIRLVRSRKTGNSKGFAFVEFEYPEVAQIAAETMNNYLMFHRLVKAAYIPPEERKFNYFKTTTRKVINKAGKEIHVSGKTSAIQKQVKMHNNWSDEAYQKRTDRAMKKFKKLQKKCEDLGIDFSNCLIQPKKFPSKNFNAKEHKGDKNASPNNKLKCANMNSEKFIKKKNFKQIDLEDLLGDTIVEEDSSEDEDFVAMESCVYDYENDDSSQSECEDDKENSQQLDLEDLLGETILEESSSVDESFVAFESPVDAEKLRKRKSQRKELTDKNIKKKKAAKKIDVEDLLGDTLVEEDSSEDEDFIISESLIESKANRKNNKIAQNVNDSYKIDLEDLLGDTIVDECSSDDEDFVPSEASGVDDDSIASENEENDPQDNRKNSKKCKTTKKIALEDLLGDTIVDEDSSEDEDFVASEVSSNDNDLIPSEDDEYASNGAKNNKNFKHVALKDLLGDTIVDEGSSDDEDYVVSGSSDDDNDLISSENDEKASDSDNKFARKNKSNKSIALEDLLGDTIVEEGSSDDEDFVASEISSENDNEIDIKEVSQKKSDKKDHKKNKAFKNPRKVEPGRIQKSNKKSSKFLSSGKEKKQLQISAAKELIAGAKKKWQTSVGAASKNKSKQKI